MTHWKRISAGLVLALLAAGVGGIDCRSPQSSPAPPPPPTPPPTRPTPPPPAPKPALEPAAAKDNAPVRVRLAHGMKEIGLQNSTTLRVHYNEGSAELPPGAWTLKAVKIVPPRQYFHVFLKSFKPEESQAMEAFLSTWRAQGYPVKAVSMGLEYRTTSGTVLDGREYWISLQRLANEKDAIALKTALERKNQWAWIRVETVLPGSGLVSVRSLAGQTMTWPLPVTLTSDAPVRVATTTAHDEARYTGTLDISAEPDYTLGIYETLPVEDYLAGVLPAEMPALWPVEALKAQAVAARSDVLTHMALKHILEGFNFTNSEGDRAYGGYSGRQPATDEAVRATAGQVLSDGSRIVPGVFSSDCGGWTEDNDAVWSSPPDGTLRAVPDFPFGSTPSAVPSADLSRWLQAQPNAYCSGDAEWFRWTRRYSVVKLSRLVNQYYTVGTIRAIEPGDRGISGRLKGVKITGTGGTVTIRKELPIRQAFGGLPSAMILIREERGPSGPVAFIFLGGGRGHGVGLCQYGARGMALQGVTYEEILRHYYAGTRLDSVR